MNTNKNRITLNMTIQDTIVAMVEGNPGALNVCMELIKVSSLGILTLLHLDDMEIYGSDIWLCYKDICKEDIKLLEGKVADRTVKRELSELKLKFGY